MKRENKLPKFSIQKIYRKGSSIINEDRLLIRNNIFGVFDGANNLAGFKNKKGKTGGELAATIAKNTFSKNDKSLKELAVESNNQILSEIKKEKVDISKKENLWLTTAAVVRLKRKEAECFQIGDSLIIIIYKSDSYKLLFKYNNHDLDVMVKWKKLSDKGVDNIWEKIKPEIKKLRKKTNITYGVLNGNKNAGMFFNFKKIRLDNIKSIILFTDGLFIPKENPKKSENWRKFTEIYKKKGLNGLLEHVRSLQKSDLKYWSYPRFKQYEDIAAIGIDF